ncbi:MAG: UxaA family hydrolase [Rhodobacteraceae bacterium]|nr:UxaA family hydrolase [Paracoccaceae bacterium]
MPGTDPRLLLLSPLDNVFVLRGVVEAGEKILLSGTETRVESRIGLGHKLARVVIPKGSKVMKYGAPIGSASQDIPMGAHVHTHNLISDYTPTHTLELARDEFAEASAERAAP